MFERFVNALSSNLIQVLITCAIVAAGLVAFYAFAEPVTSIPYP